jgi:microcystin-dependent protein
MSDPFVAEIRMFGFNFAPKGWAFCNGQLLPLSQNTALFSLLGTMYGGDGKSTFALPDLQDSVPIEWGQSTTGTLYDEGQMSGAEFITLLVSEMPLHNHTLSGNFNAADVNDPSPARCLAKAGTGFLYQSTTNANLVTMAPQALPPAGGSLPHNNMMPYLVVNFCIALQGVFPPRG